jgi:2-C-methyl-D-erythritol 2,4-cyclodiphosphate synthase
MKKKPQSSLTNFQIGIGYDVHRLVTDRKLKIGGVLIPNDKGLLGHSDADVLIHAICDAMLGAAALGDIGMHFPDSDKRFKGISSLILLKQVTSLIRRNGYEIGNIDSTVILEYPKIGKYTDAMKKKMGKVLGISPSKISIKATTHELLGSFGRGEGCAAMAIVSLRVQGEM